MPLSETVICHSSPSWCALTVTFGGTPSRWNFRPLPIRLTKSARSSEASPRTIGSGPTSIMPSTSERAGSSWATAALTTSSSATSPNADVVRPTRENASRSLISCCMRSAPSTANAMYWSARSSILPA